MSVAANQQRTFLKLLADLRPHWRRDAALPARIQALLARRREFGSRDRRLYRELVYTTLRYLPWIEPMLDADGAEAVRRVAWLAAETPATRAFRAELALGEPPAGDRAELLPGWFRSHCPEIFHGAELEAQIRRATLCLRWQTSDRATVGREFEDRGWSWRQSEVLASAVELPTDADVTTSAAWRTGQVEVQDLGSQLLLETIGIAPGGRWLDACAGAGGKTLQLAVLLAGGHIDAHDIRPAALEELRTRAARARHVCHLIDDKRPLSPRGAQEGCHLIDDTSPTARGGINPECHLIDDTRPTTIRLLSPGDVPPGGYDGVLVDAPCSGSGTWRRAPHLKWVTTEASILSAAAIQRRLLAEFAGHVRPGGRLVYATCSLSSRENEEGVNAFLAAHPDFSPAPFTRTFRATPRGPGLLILPSQHDTDGFYVASLRRRG